MSEDQPQRVEVRFELSVGPRTIEASVPIPDAPMRVADLLPVLLAFDDAVVAMAGDALLEAGKTIPCGPGCGMCCRQLVPVSEAEAQYLAELVEAMPAELQARVRERFGAAAAALGEPMLARLRDLRGLATVEARQRIGEEYFRLGVPCPFLEDESCSIHEHRPMPCREYMVTSPPPNCRDPRPGSIEPVPMPVKLSTILYRFGDGMGEETMRWVALVLALEERGARWFPGPAMFRNFVRQARRIAENNSRE
jgi:Fe-S-cluster containining protein